MSPKMSFIIAASVLQLSQYAYSNENNFKIGDYQISYSETTESRISEVNPLLSKGGEIRFTCTEDTGLIRFRIDEMVDMQHDVDVRLKIPGRETLNLQGYAEFGDNTAGDEFSYGTIKGLDELLNLFSTQGIMDIYIKGRMADFQFSQSTDGLSEAINKSIEWCRGDSTEENSAKLNSDLPYQEPLTIQSCQSLGEITYLSSTAHLDQNDANELKQMIKSATLKHEINPDYIEKAKVYGAGNHGNNGPGLTDINWARKDALLSALYITARCSSGAFTLTKYEY